MGLRAAGEPAGSVHRSGGRTATAYLAAHAGSWSNAYDLARGILAVVAAGHNPASFAGRNLVAALRAKIGADGGIGPAANSTYWGVLALRAAGASVPAATLRYIRVRAAPNGGYGWSPSAAPDSNDTAAAVLALHARASPCGGTPIAHAYRLPAPPRRRRPRLRPDPGRRGRQPVDLVGDPGPACVRPAQPPLAGVAARPPAAERRVQLPAGHDDHPAFVTAQVLPAVHGKWYPDPLTNRSLPL